MVAYSFRPRFIDPILWGRKDQTIRLPRRGQRGHAQPGQRLQLYTGMRTKACRLIMKTSATSLLEVMLRFRPIIEVVVDDEKLTGRELEAFARRDGFTDFEDMLRFWVGAHGDLSVFRGECIRWIAPGEPVEMGADLRAVAA